MLNIIKTNWCKFIFLILYRIIKYSYMLDHYNKNFKDAFRINFDVFNNIVENDFISKRLGKKLGSFQPVYFIDSIDKIIFISSYSLTEKVFHVCVLSRKIGNNLGDYNKKSIFALLKNSSNLGYKKIKYGLHKDFKSKDCELSLNEIYNISKDRK